MEKALQQVSGRSGLLLLGLSLGYFMVLLDMTVVSVALPAIHEDLGGGLIDLQWVVNAYTIVFAGLLLSMGVYADRLGAKRVYVGGLILFFAGSAASAVVSDIGALIALRAILGIGGAALLPASLSLLSHAYPVPGERAKALGIWTAVTGAAMAAGPVIGGILSDSFGWRSIFLLNVPLAAISLLLTYLLADETPRSAHKGFDAGGQVSVLASIAALSFSLMEGQYYGWSSPVILGTFGLAILCMILFVFLEAKGRAPLFPLSLFRNGTVSAGLVAGMAINVGLSGVLFVLPLYFQQSKGLSAHAAGLSLLPMMLPLAFNPILTGRIVSRIGARTPMAAGFGLGAAGTLLLAWAASGTSYAWTFIGLILIGFGVSLTIPSLMAAVMSSAPREQTGAVSGAVNASRQLGSVLGVALLGAVLNGSQSFLSGMRLSFILIAILLSGGSVLTLAVFGKKR
ncbi:MULTISPECIES: MFS transporter [unclassified Paenibacillus]|uniref:MFS transporter n=1 Tax=unclassified Paenibacillus TaxID=185978 RepID=UPI0010478726|nr:MULTISPECIES: MFS transporter [unclassified Paenibacillus]NIK68272.1 DHA2 family methylenomycin A resistance protein-like MFS transporter [Paenibacillus sp. BK720]TCM99513.1 EmrB/QacA subfamily drug resistance transporter [Paenibacillus sp. BK033]